MTPARNSILSIALIICLLIAAGCTNSAGPTQHPVQATQPPVQVTQQYTAVSYDATHVQYAKVNGVTLAYREFGSGEPLLMITGFGNTMKDWNPTFIGILAAKYHVYIYDPRGMGSSSDDTTITPSMSQYADDAASLMTALGQDSMNVYGASMGSSTSQQLVIDHPERVKKLVLDSNTYSIRIPETKKLLGMVETANASHATPEGTRREAQANLAWRGSWDHLSGINKEVILVVGTSDDLTPEAVSVRMSGQIKGSRLVRFKGLPHVGSHYAPVEYGENALAFLGKDELPRDK